jgi:unsaturated chondroitin disaccharide hydrolase
MEGAFMRWFLWPPVLAVAFSGPISRADPIDMTIQNDLKFIAQQAHATVGSLSSAAAAFPEANGQNGKWSTTNATAWTSGFFPGELWLLYQATGSTYWRNEAEAWTTPLASQATRTYWDIHDVGFIIGESFGNGYRLTGKSAYEAEIFAAANTLAKNYSPLVGAVESWSNTQWSYPVIVDGMMTLAPLEWGATHGGPSQWGTDARNHAITTAKYLIRSDGSVIHLANFNPTTGAFLGVDNAGAYTPSATIARVQAWGVYGYVQAYQATGSYSFLGDAEKLANFFIANLPKGDVPYADFNAPSGVTPPLDTSAAAIAADAFVMLGADAATTTQRSFYLTEAKNILSSLSTSFLANGPGSEAVLLDGAASNQVDTALIFGDYFFTEALVRLEGVLANGTTWSLYGPLWPATTSTLSDLAIDPLRATTVVPEPSTWAMTAIGLVVLGCALGRRHLAQPAVGA